MWIILKTIYLFFKKKTIEKIIKGINNKNKKNVYEYEFNLANLAGLYMFYIWNTSLWYKNIYIIK